MSAESIRILIIEDEDQLREMLHMTLEEEGYEIVSVPSGERALEESLSSSFDLVIADVKLTGMDGLDTLAQLKKGSSELKSMVITGYATEADSIRAISLGVGHYMKKPFKLQDFLQAVAHTAAQIRAARREQSLRENIDLGCLWVVDQLLELRECERKDELRHVAERVESHLLKARHSATTARELRLSILAAEIGLPELEKLTPFLPNLLSSGTLGLLTSLENSEDSDSEEVGLARRALDSYRQGSKQVKLFVKDMLGETKPSEPLTSNQDTGRLLALAKALENSGDAAGAAKVLSRIEEATAASSGQVLLSKALMAWRQGQSDKSCLLLEEAFEKARGLSERNQVFLEGGIALCQMNHTDKGLNWLAKATDGLAQLNNSMALARSRLATDTFSQNYEDIALEAIRMLLEPRNLEQLFQSSGWLLPYLLSLDIGQQDVKRLAARIVHNMPKTVSELMQVSRLSEDRLLKGLDLIQEVGAELYDDTLDDLILNGSESVRKKATEVLREGSGAQLNPVLRLYSLGIQRTWVGESLVADKGWSGTKPRLLLTYLAQNPDVFVGQEQVVDIFWDGSASGNRNLNQALALIRQSLRISPESEELDYVERRGSTLGLNPELPTWHDAAVVHEHLLKAQKHHSAARMKEACDSFEQAIDLDRGEFLEGHYEDWVITFRENLRRALDQGGQTLADIHLEQNRPSEALRVAQHVYSTDRFSERVVGTIMKAHAALNNPVEALKCFDTFEARLKREMELEPTMDLLRLYHQTKMVM